MTLNRFFSSLLLAAVAIPAFAAADTDSVPVVRDITAPGIISVVIPAGLDSRLVRSDSDSDETPQDTPAAQQPNPRSGYRVQIFDDNNPRTAKQEAQRRRQVIESRFPEFRVYVQFNSPYWRVKVGDFRTRSEAESAMAAIRAQIPSFAAQLRIVRDRINPTN